MSLIDQLPSANFIKDLVIEGRPVEHRFHLLRDRVTLVGPARNLICERNVNGVICRVSAFKRGGGNLQAPCMPNNLGRIGRAP